MGVDGTDGRTGVSGQAGQGCVSTNGYIVDQEWRAGVAGAQGVDSTSAVDGRGGNGALGRPGGGGGGGGAGSGVSHTDFFCAIDFVQATGGGGGGGGAGGCGGGGGRGGLSGGGSFAFLVIFTQPLDSVPMIQSNRIVRGFGGDGGDGGNGAEGGDGNLGKSAQQLSPDDQVGLLACAKPGAVEAMEEKAVMVVEVAEAAVGSRSASSCRVKDNGIWSRGA